ncbi:MAG: four helix bundle protein [Chitinophagales bacterium]|nr:four helix bundle protein [Chitinophagales bacterium]
MEAKKKIYDLLERTEKFSLRTRDFYLRLKKDLINRENIIQLIRSSGSVAAFYIEANENPGNGDFKYWIKVCRKESKESKLWLKHVLTDNNGELENERLELIQEAFEPKQIFWCNFKKACAKRLEIRNDMRKPGSISVFDF